MAKDTKKALQQMQEQLAWEEARDRIRQSDAKPCPVRNSDRADLDLEEYADRVLNPPKKKLGGCMIFWILLLLAMAFGLGYLALRMGGFLG